MDSSRTPSLQEQFGEIDIYLFDQILKGRINPGMRVLDAGCGGGRNLVYLLQQGYEVFGVDLDWQAIESVRALAARHAPRLPRSNFEMGALEALSFRQHFDVVISSAVLHFARDDVHFDSMLQGMWRTLKTGGLLFCRLASSIGIESQITQIGGRRFWLPDGSERYLVDEEILGDYLQRLNAELVEPLKTTVVQNQRSMSTWILRRLA